MKENFNDGDTVVGLRFDVLNVVHRGGHGPFAHRDKTLLHFLGRDTGIAPDHAHHRNIDVWENVRGHSGDRDHADQHDQHGHDREAVWPSQC